MMKALIYENTVVQLAEQEFEVAPSLIWRDCPVDVKVGWSFDGSSFTAPEIPIKSYAEKKAEEMPSMYEKVEALYESIANANNSKLNSVKAKIANVESKYPDV